MATGDPDDEVRRGVCGMAGGAVAAEEAARLNGKVCKDGRPCFAGPSIGDVEKVEVAAIDPDCDRGLSLCP
jgi:hypothetical protein